ncbi:MAG: hypothetical protein OEU26_09270 [Candidatus Tectomicrobia bacterium]|nr:hypothetical protein [Candidatus Tectomicrobia bacterium]
MAERSRLGPGMFDWADENREGGQEEATPATPSEADAATEGPTVEAAREGNETAPSEARPGAQRQGERSVFVKYRKDNGDIVSVGEALPNRESSGVPWPSIPDDMAVHEFTLEGELLDKQIVEIHHQCQVTTFGSRPQLTRKT